METSKNKEKVKNLLSSKTIHFNWASGVVVHAIWPFLPKHFRDQPYAVSAITSWFIIGNISLRFMTREAIFLFTKRDDGQGAGPK